MTQTFIRNNVYTILVHLKPSAQHITVDGQLSWNFITTTSSTLMRPWRFQSSQMYKTTEAWGCSVPTHCTSDHELIVTSHPHTVRLTCRREWPAILEFWNGNEIKIIRPQHSKMYIINDATGKYVCIYYFLRSWDRDNALEALCLDHSNSPAFMVHEPFFQCVRFSDGF